MNKFGLLVSFVAVLITPYGVWAQDGAPKRALDYQRAMAPHLPVPMSPGFPQTQKHLDNNLLPFPGTPADQSFPWQMPEDLVANHIGGVSSFNYRHPEGDLQPAL